MPETPDQWDLIVRLLRSYALRRYGREPLGLSLHFGGQPPHYEPFPPRAPDPVDAGPARNPGPEQGPEPWHLSDWQRVYWPGAGTFTLTPKQAKVVARLWQAWEDGRPEVAQADLLRAADSDSTRLVDLFKSSPAWRKLVVSPSPGVYRLPELPDPDA